MPPQQGKVVVTGPVLGGGVFLLKLFDRLRLRQRRAYLLASPAIAPLPLHDFYYLPKPAQEPIDPLALFDLALQQFILCALMNGCDSLDYCSGDRIARAGLRVVNQGRAAGCIVSPG